MKRHHPPIDRATLIGLIICLTLAVSPHVPHLSPWISGYYFLLAGVRLLALHPRGRLPGRWLLLLLTLAAIANVIFHHTLLIGRDAGVALLVAMLGLKLLETRTQRDIYVGVFLGYFLVVTQFLFSQGLGIAVYMFAVIVGLTAVLLPASQALPPRNWWRPVRQSLLLLLQATPIMLALFFLFPRLSGPIWNLDIQSSSGVTGLSDSLSPGSVSHLSQSRAIAFRVQFEGPMPEAAQRYWRGPVFWATDGKNWSVHREGKNSGEEEGADFIRFGSPVAHTVTLEATRERWAFALELPDTIPNGSQLTSDFQLLMASPIHQEISYRVISYPEYRTLALRINERYRALQLPDNVTPRMRELAQSWRNTAAGPAEIIAMGMRHFREQPFVYTLNPPILRSNPADEFLFDTRRGFCEHFATSFTLLMRLAGLPARVVAGYQGGEYNRHGDYLIVRQSDAHAWTEVWLNGRGWVRVDPTAAVAPERIERPIDVEGRGVGLPIRFELSNPGILKALLRESGYLVDAVNMAWRHWVRDYDNRQQNQLLSLFGLGFIKDYALGVTAVVVTGVVFLLIALSIWGSSRERVRAVDQWYRVFCGKLEKLGLKRRSFEGPKDFAQRVIRRRPELRDAVDPITRLYIGLKYGPPGKGKEKALKILKRRVRRFKVANRSGA